MFKTERFLFNEVNCHVLEKHIAQAKQKSSCWNMAKEIDDSWFYGNICQDCIVHVYSKENNEHTQKDLEKILDERKKILH